MEIGKELRHHFLVGAQDPVLHGGSHDEVPDPDGKRQDSDVDDDADEQDADVAALLDDADYDFAVLARSDVDVTLFDDPVFGDIAARIDAYQSQVCN